MGSSKARATEHQAYSFTYVAGREEARTPLETIFIILTRKGGDRHRRGY